MSFQEITAQELLMNPMTRIAKEWMLVTAGDGNSYNTMTASWGHFGSLWGRGGGMPTSVIFVRPQRYTREFVDREQLYSLCFFPKQYKEQMGYLGTHSGRDGNKVAQTGLTPLHGSGYTYFEEASLVLVCRKLYRAPLEEANFLDKQIMEESYPERDFHMMYIGAIEKVLVPKQVPEKARR
jgi:flavin reductase (DIM6/NTAB) family NADH-FMN oxidoreductase RutF